MKVKLISCQEVEEVGGNDQILMYDDFCGRYFLSTEKQVKEAVDKISDKISGKLTKEGYLTTGDVLCSLFTDLGLSHDLYLWDLCDDYEIEPIEIEVKF